MKKHVIEYYCDICGKTMGIKEYKQLLLPCRITYNNGIKTYESNKNKNQWAEFDVCEHCESIISEHFKKCVADMIKNIDTGCVNTNVILEELK